MDNMAENFESALEAWLSAEYQRGKADGLAVARRIRDWLTRQPDREWQREVREWADKAIARAERQRSTATNTGG
jgi:hypothetical protein